jgi:hypothetical protein
VPTKHADLVSNATFPDHFKIFYAPSITKHYHISQSLKTLFGVSAGSYSLPCKECFVAEACYLTT